MIEVQLTRDEIIALLYSTEFQSLYTNHREEEDVRSAKEKLQSALAQANDKYRVERQVVARREDAQRRVIQALKGSVTSLTFRGTLGESSYRNDQDVRMAYMTEADLDDRSLLLTLEKSELLNKDVIPSLISSPRAGDRQLSTWHLPVGASACSGLSAFRCSAGSRCRSCGRPQRERRQRPGTRGGGL